MVAGNGATRLRFANPVAGAVKVSVFDATGRLINRDERFRPAGTQEFPLPLSASGVGFATVTSAGQVSTAKFTSVR